MTRIVKQIVLIVASLIMLIGATGCMDNNKNNTTITLDEAKTTVLDYLSHKYGKSFECIGYQEPSLINNEYTFALVEEGKNYEGYGFKAHYSPNAQHKIVDGYFGVLTRDETTQFVSNSKFCDEFKAFVEFSRNTYDGQLNSSSTLSDAVEIHGKLRVYYHVFISSKSEYDIVKLKESLPVDTLSGKVSYYIVSDDELSRIEYDNLNATLGGIVDGTISVESKGEFDF